MKAGDTFFLAGGAADRHLRVIISEPSIDPNRVLFVSMTSYDVTKEDVCLLEIGDHPFVQHRTCIAYADCREAPLEALIKLRDAGHLRPAEPVSTDLLARIRQGAS
jgi:hypothetical protein